MTTKTLLIRNFGCRYCVSWWAVCLRCSAYAAAATLSLYVLRVFSPEFLLDTLACRKQVKFVSQTPTHIPMCLHPVRVSHTTIYIFAHFIAFFIIHSLVKFILVSFSPFMRGFAFLLFCVIVTMMLIDFVISNSLSLIFQT